MRIIALLAVGLDPAIGFAPAAGRAAPTITRAEDLPPPAGRRARLAGSVITYEVTAIVEARLAETYERYMRQQHIRDVLATGCFQSAELAK